MEISRIIRFNGLEQAAWVAVEYYHVGSLSLELIHIMLDSATAWLRLSLKFLRDPFLGGMLNLWLYAWWNPPIWMKVGPAFYEKFDFIFLEH